MGKIAVITDSNAYITPTEAKQMGVYVIPMPFMINQQNYLENIDLDQEQFYEMLGDDADVITSQPTPYAVMELWDSLLKEYDEIVHIPMSSGLSSACATATALSDDYDGKVQVVNNQRISITQKQSARDALMLVEKGYSAKEIKDILEEDKFNSSIYIMVNTLKYLKKGGRITPAAAALGTLLKIKPVLQIQGEKLDSFAKARTIGSAKNIMIKALRNDMENRFGGVDPEKCMIQMAYTFDKDAIADFKKDMQEAFPDFVIEDVDPLSLSVSCHIGPGAIACAVTKRLIVS